MVIAVNSRDKFLQAAAIRTSKDFLSMEEKPSLISEYSVILNTQINLAASATTYAVTTEMIAYDAAILALTTLLEEAITPVAWNDLSNITFISRASLATNIANVYTAERDLRSILMAKQSISGNLTVPNISMPADSSNVVSAPVLAASGGTFKVFAGTLDITTGNSVAYSIVGTPVGCSVTINATTGVYVPTAITADNASAVLRATLPSLYGGMIIDVPFNLSRVKSGVNGVNGKTLSLSTDALTFKIDKAGTVTPSSINLTAISSNLAGGSTAVFTVTSGTGVLSGTGDTRNLTYANMATNSISISVTKDGITDQVTIVKLLDGIDTINGVLTNESHTLTSDSAGFVSSYAGAVCSLNIFRGVSNDNASWSFSKADSGVTSSILGNTVTLSNIPNGTSTGYVDITATRSGFASITKRFTISKASQGSAGSPGSNGKALTLSSDSLVFKVDKDGAVTPASINLTAMGSNLAGGSTATFTISSGIASLTGTGDARNLTYASMTSSSVTISVTKDGMSDVVTITKLLEGLDSINGILTNESHSLTSDSSGIVASYTGAVCSMNVYKGITNDTGSWSFSKVDSTGITSGLSGNTVTVTNMTAGTLSGYVDITATRSGFASITKRFTISKSYQGSAGTNGTNGTNGKSLALVSDSLTYKVDKAGVATPTSINLTAMGNNLAGGSTATFTVTSGSATLTGTGDMRNFTYASMGASPSVTISVTKDGLSDVVTIVKLLDGVDTINAVLTNESHNLTADISGVVTDYTGASCTLNIFKGTANDNAGWTISKADSLGITSSLSGSTVSVTNITNAALSGYVDITATKSGFATIVKRFTIAKSIQGATGSTGSSTYTVTVYYRGTTTPTVNNSTGSYNFSNGTLVVPTGNVTWLPTQPATTTDPTWATSFTFTGTAAAGAVTAGTWTTPRIEAQNGTNGTPGVSGEFRDVIELYSANATVPTRPTANSYYNFNNNTISSTTPTVTAVPNWSMTMPTPQVGVPVYMITQLASTTTPATDVTLSPNTAWTTPVIVAQRGNDGNSTITGTAYYQSTIPSSVAITGGGFNNSTQNATPPTGAGVTWVTTQPNTSTTKPVTYVTTFNYVGGSGTSTTTVGGGTWTTPTIEAVHGIPEMGGEFRDVVQLYGTTTTKPSVTTYYNFDNKTISTSSGSVVAVANWSLTKPAASVGSPVYMITQTARTTTSATSVAMGANDAWSNPVIVNEVFANGSFSALVSAYFQTTAPSAAAITGGSYNFATSTLSVPTGGGVTWVATQPSTTTSPTYATDFIFSGLSSATVAGGTWTVPRVEAVNGATGPSGEFRDFIQLYGFTTTRPTATTYYNFSTNTISSSNSSQVAVSNWSLIQPEPTVGNPVYVITQFARTNDSTANVHMLPNTAWTAPAIVAQVGAAGAPGSQGLSYVTAYVASSVATTTTVPTQSTGVTSGNYQTTVPTGGGLGAVTWQKTIPTLGANQYMYQTDGIYDPVAGTITWSIPYWSSLKVGSLSVITAETGNLTVTGNIDAGTGATSWHIDSLGNMWSGAASFGAAPFSVTSTGVGKFNGSIQVGTAAISGTTTTGSGAQFNSSGTFALGTAASNLTYNGTEMYLNGDIKIPSGVNFRASTNIYCQVGGAGFAVVGVNNNNGGIAIQGQTSGTSATGVYGVALNSTSYGVSGESTTGTATYGLTTSGKAIYGRSFGSTGYSGYFYGGKLGIATGTPLELTGVTGNTGQTLISKGSSATPAWGMGMDSGATSTDASGNAVLTVKNMQSSSFGISGTTTSGCFLVITAGPTATANPNEYTIPVQTQFTTTGAPASNLPIRWLAIG